DESGKSDASLASSPEAAQQLLRERERVESLRTQLTVLDREISARNADRDRILKSIASYQARVDRIPVREQEMSSLTRDYEIAQAHYKSLLDKKLAAGMATDMERRQQAERFELLDPARVPEKPASPNRGVFDTVGVLISLAFGTAVVLIKG